MFGEIISNTIEGQNDKIAGVIDELSSIFNGGINPETKISGNSETGFSIEGGGTFVADDKVHGSLTHTLSKILSKTGQGEISGSGSLSKEVAALQTIGKGVDTVKNQYSNLSMLVEQKIQNIDYIKEMLVKGFNKLFEIASSDPSKDIDKNSIKYIQDKIFAEFDRQLGILQNVLKVNIKPTQTDLLDLLKKNKDFTTLAETLGVAYGDETASDRLALVFTNISDVSILSNKVKEALKELNISLSEYKNIKNSELLYNELYKVFENFNKKKLNTDLPKMLEAMNVLKNNQTSHDKIVQHLSGNSSLKSQMKKARGEDEDKKSSSSSSSSSEEEDSDSEKQTTGGAYEKEIGRIRKTRLKSSLSKRIQTYEKTMKELYRSYMNQVNRSFKGLVESLELLTNKVGSEIVYDEDLRDFIFIFKGFNDDIDNEKIFYSLIGLDASVSGRELKSRFSDTVDKIIAAANKLKNYKIFNDISKQLQHFKEVNDTMADTVLNLKKTEQEKSGSSDFMWTDKILEQSFSINNIKLIKNSIKKLSFYAKVGTIKENLNSMNKEQKLYQEDYDKLLGKSIGLKLTEIKKEYVENVDRLNDKLRGRGRLLEEHNKTNPSGSAKHLPRGLVETIYKLQYEAKDGLYRSLEAIDLYLMYFTENLSAYPEAIMDLNQMLEQTDIIAKWFTQKSVDNLADLLQTQVDTSIKEPTLPTTLSNTLNIPPLLQNSSIVQNQIKIAFEKTKKCIDSIAVLKNIISMFVHLGNKYGNVNLSDKLNISPNMIYKHLVKYIWVSAFTMGYGTAGGDKSVANADSANKGNYEPESGNFESFFDVLFTTIVLPLDVYKEVEDNITPKLNAIINNTASSATDTKLVNDLLNRLRKDIFIIDDRYFILGIKSMVGKIFTVVDTHSLLHTPDTLANIMRNPVRMIIGAGNATINQDAIELYIRLPLLVEFYKSIFEDGNLKYKNNVDKDNETETIAYIPELGTVWSGLIQCIFDESKYIKDGIYSINNVKDIVNEVNKIYANYVKNTNKDKLVRTVVLDLVAEINRRYGILKKKDIAEFYQIKKKYVKNIVDSKYEDDVNFDILDENNEYERAGPSSQYVESSFNKYSDESLVFTDIKLVRDFRNNIYNELFSDQTVINDLSSKSFNEKIKYCKKQIEAAESNDAKFELIASAIDQSSNINAYNVDVYLLFHELVISPVFILNSIKTTINASNTNIATMITSNPSKYSLISELYKLYNDNNLFKIKMINNNKILIDYSQLQNNVELYIENIKYMISKFRNLICKELIVQNESELFKLENSLLNIIIKDDSSAENYNSQDTLETLNLNINQYLETASGTTSGDLLYKHIVFGDDNAKAVNRSNPILTDINQIYDASKRSWSPKTNIKYFDYVLGGVNILSNNNSFDGKSILQKFNMLVFSYVEQFYNTSTKKIYSKLIDEFANKSMSATIFEYGGIPDMVNSNAAIAPGNLNYALLNKANVLSITTSTILRTLLTRTLNIQLPVKYHLVDNISEVSSVQLEKYRAYLPVFLNYFEKLIQECIIYKKLLDNPKFDVGDITNPAVPSISNLVNLVDDYNSPITYDNTLQQADGTFLTYKRNYHEILNNIMNGSRSLINDMTNVLNELNYVSQYGNLRENFIKNFYNNNLQLPYLPLSLLTPISDNTAFNNLLPIHSINTDENKYIYATNHVLNNDKNNDDNLNNYLWLKEQVKVYNNGVVSTNSVDSKKLSEFINLNNSFINYGYLLFHINNNLWYKTASTPAAVQSSSLPLGSTLNEIVNIIENALNENKKHGIVTAIINGICTKDDSLKEYSLDRKKARILNVIDLNINPINVHALMREIPLVNVYNYAFTFDNIVKSFVYNVNPDDLYTTNTKNWAPTDPNDLNLFRLSTLLQEPYFIDYMADPDASDSNLLFKNALTLNHKPAKYNVNKNMNLASPKLSTNLFNELDTKYLNTNGSSSTLFHNNKFLRNILFLINLQRVIRLKIKNAVYKINSNVVSDNNIINMRITDYPNDNDTDIQSDEFEITDLF